MGKEEENKNPPQSSIIDRLLKLLMHEYSINGKPEDLELKTTLDIVEEMETIADVSKNDVAEALEKGGYGLRYTEAGIYWELYRWK